MPLHWNYCCRRRCARFCSSFCLFPKFTLCFQTQPITWPIFRFPILPHSPFSRFSAVSDSTNFPIPVFTFPNSIRLYDLTLYGPIRTHPSPRAYFTVHTRSARVATIFGSCFQCVTCLHVFQHAKPGCRLLSRFRCTIQVMTREVDRRCVFY